MHEVSMILDWPISHIVRHLLPFMPNKINPVIVFVVLYFNVTK